MTETSKLLTGDEVAAVLRVSKRALAQMRYRGQAPRGFKVGAQIVYKLEDVEAWIEARREADEAKREHGFGG